jgi:hypothetical protein
MHISTILIAIISATVFIDATPLVSLVRRQSEADEQRSDPAFAGTSKPPRTGRHGWH